MKKVEFKDISIGDVIMSGSKEQLTVTFKSDPGERWVVTGIDNNCKTWTLPIQHMYRKEAE